MAEQITPTVLNAPGFNGLNLQDSPVGLDGTYALVASNAIIEQSGRIAARKGWTSLNTTNTDLGTANITCLGEVVENSGTSTVVCAGNGFLFKLSGTTLTTLTYGGGGVAPTISANNWQFCQLSGVGIFWQRGYDPLIYDPAVSTTTFRRLNEKTGTTGTVQQANTAISAYGRIWCADLTANKNTVYFSDTLSPHVWTGGSSGSLNLYGVWPKGGDEIVALAAHNNSLIIFGRNQTLVYTGADTPSTMTLSDNLDSVGCIARDSVQNTSGDLWFLSDSGVRSLQRTIQEKSAPLREISTNVRDELSTYVDAETMANVKSVYSPHEAFYLLTMPASSITYCFDTRRIMENGAARVTHWPSINLPSLLYTTTRKLYFGMNGKIGEYTAYLDNASAYRFSWYTPWLDLGNPIVDNILKRMIFSLIGTGNQTVIVKWAYDFSSDFFTETKNIGTGFDVAEWGLAEWGLGEFSGGTGVSYLSVQGKGSGVLTQIGLETDINGDGLSVQKITIFSKEGRFLK